MKYSVKEIKKLYDNIETHLNEEEQYIIKQIISNYNRLFIYARDKKEYIERKEKQYIKESDENDRLKIKVKQLEEKVNNQRSRIDILLEQIKEFKKDKI